MGALTSIETETVERAKAEPMLDQVLAWAAVNSGSRNLGGLERMADLLADAFAALPGLLRLENPAPVEAVDTAGHKVQLRHGRHLHLAVRPTAPVQLLFTGHMDTVFGADHEFQETRWIEDGVLGGPGVADMKGGIAVMLEPRIPHESGLGPRDDERCGIEGTPHPAVVDVDVDRGPTERRHIDVRHARELVDQLHAQTGVQRRGLELAKAKHQGPSSTRPFRR